MSHQESAYAGMDAHRDGFQIRGGGRQHSTILNSVPPGMDELKEEFVRMTAEELAGTWVALVVDASMGEYRVGDLARALIVVAERLHGVKFPEAVAGMEVKAMDSNLMPAAKSVGVLSSLRPHVPESRPPAMHGGEGWSVETEGFMPLPKGRKTVDPALLAAACALGMPPARMRLDAKKYPKSRVLKMVIPAVEQMGGPKDLTCFKASDGATILHRRVRADAAAAGQPARTEPGTPRSMSPDTAPTPPVPSHPPMNPVETAKMFDKHCGREGQSVVLAEVKGMESAEARTAAADALRKSGRYTVRAEFVKGHSGRNLVATRVA
jgi:hypothetical protein